MNSDHDSLTPIGGFVPLFNIQTDEVIFGGVGSGLIWHVAVRHRGGVHCRAHGGQDAGVSGKENPAEGSQDGHGGRHCHGLRHPCVHGASARSFPLPRMATGIPPDRPSPISPTPGPTVSASCLYAYSSAPENNGSAFAGLSANTPWYNLTLGLAMLLGRFAFIIPALAIAGSLVAKKRVPSSSGTFPTHGALFVGLLVGTVIVIGALTFFPALSLGPLVEHYLMHQGKLFSSLMLSIWS